MKLIVVDGIDERYESAPLHARHFSQALRKLTATCHHKGVTVVFLTHLRQKIGVVFGNPPHSPNALKFYASVRVDFRKRQAGTRLHVVKNKCSAPFRSAYVHIEPKALTDVQEES